MNWITVFGILAGLAATVATVVNVIYANAATVHPHLETSSVPDKVVIAVPDNQLGPTYFSPGQEYLDLILINDGPGVAKGISWKITMLPPRAEQKGSTTNTTPYLGRASKTNVLGYIEKMSTTEEIEATHYEISVHYRPILGIRYHEVKVKFDGSGQLKEYRLDDRSIENHYVAH